MIGAVGALVSFAEGSALLHELAGVTVNPTSGERTAEALGQAITADETAVVEPAVVPLPPTLYLGLDGLGRGGLQGRHRYPAQAGRDALD
jgi:hypothetical protein